MRSVGVKNINLVKKTTIEEIKRSIEKTGHIVRNEIEEETISRLPEELWDTWEGADGQIREIIDDVIMEY